MPCPVRRRRLLVAVAPLGLAVLLAGCEPPPPEGDPGSAGGAAEAVEEVEGAATQNLVEVRWIGTAPWCAAGPSDCTSRGWRYERSDSRGDGSSCWSGSKVLCSCRQPVNRRPFYNIYHRANSISEVEKGLAAGANAIEFDIRFDDDTGQFCVNHDTTLFCQRDELTRYLKGVHAIAKRPGSPLALVVLDFKDEGNYADAALELLEWTRGLLTNDTGIKVILSVSSLSRKNVLFQAGPLRSGEAVAIDEENNAQLVAGEFERQGLSRTAYGNGTFAKGISLNIKSSIQQGVAARNAGRFDFVYVWTLEAESSMRDFINLGVDGILVNNPATLRSVLRDGCWPLRLATRDDNPFQ